MSVTQETIAYESIGTASMASINNDDLTITKPSGLEVGDLMVAILSQTASSASSWTLPSGWTSHFDFAENSHNLAIFSKLAEASDVAASNFSFTPNNGSSANLAGGFILRISGAGEVLTPTSATATAVTTLAPTTITPDFGNSMFVLVASEGNNNPNTNNVSGYSMATSNPTWTERGDTSNTEGASWGSVVAVATAVRSEATASGAFTVNFGSTTDRAYAVALCITPQRNGSVTASEQDVNLVQHPHIPEATVSLTETTPTTDSSNQSAITNKTKSPASNITNKDKS